MLGGYGGQFSFGHAAFFGTAPTGPRSCSRASASTPMPPSRRRSALGAAVGAIIGFLSFRSGLRGSYFALVTLAFAEVFRILANASPLHRRRGGHADEARRAAREFPVREPRDLLLDRAGAGDGRAARVTRAIERSRFGAYLVAIRENEDAAKALGVDTLKVKVQAITLSAAITAAAGAFYAQYFLFVDANIAFGTWISIEALLAPIIGGLGTALRPADRRARAAGARRSAPRRSRDACPAPTSRSMARCWSSPSPSRRLGCKACFSACGRGSRAGRAA